MHKTMQKFVLMACMATSVFAAEGKPSLASRLLVISMPEPAYTAILAVDLVAVAALVVVLRRRIARN